jgi:DNA repair exonuclease SbcCD ATPase subunit
MSKSQISDSTSNSTSDSTSNSTSDSSSDSTSNSSSDSTSESISSEKDDIYLINILSQTSLEIKTIYHISDIHIRNDQRHDEYELIFNKLYKILSSNSGLKHSIIVITGDIMHSKTELSPEAVSLAKNLFKNLSQIMPLIIIPGNHDCNLSNVDRMDAITPILQDTSYIENIHYLIKTGVYVYNNITFGYVSIYDERIVKANKIKIKNQISYDYEKIFKIGLYHGAVHGAETDVGARMNRDEFTAKIFNGYDFVLLGDIHKFQFMNEEKTIAYAGSLIQQSHGEHIKNHGFVKWTLNKENNIAKHIQIDNDYGYCTLYVNDNELVSNNELIIPSKPRLRFYVTNTEQAKLIEIQNKLQEDYDVQEIIIKNNITKTKNLILDEDKKMYDPNFHETIVKNYLVRRDKSNDDINSILTLHKEIYNECAKKISTSVKLQKWKISKLKFSNMLSYGEDNVINFDGFQLNHIIAIVAPNHYGKSAIIDIILFCLFDKFTRSDRTDIMNSNKDNMFCSLKFKIGNKEFIIERSGKKIKNRIKINVDFYEIVNKKRITLNGLDRNDTNKKIMDLVGTYNDYLATSFVLQEDNNNFLTMTHMEKKNYLKDLLRLNIFDYCHEHAKGIWKEMVTKLKIMENSFKEQNPSQLMNDIKEWKKMETSLLFEIEHFNSIKNIFFDKKYEKPLLITLNEISDLSLNNIDSNKELDEIINNLQDEQNKLQIEVNSLNLDELNSIKDDLIKEKLKLESKLNKFLLENDVNSLNIQYSKLLDEKAKLNITESMLKINISDIKSKISKFDKLIKTNFVHIELIKKRYFNLIPKDIAKINNELMVNLLSEIKNYEDFIFENHDFYEYCFNKKDEHSTLITSENINMVNDLINEFIEVLKNIDINNKYISHYQLKIKNNNKLLKDQLDKQKFIIKYNNNVEHYNELIKKLDKYDQQNDEFIQNELIKIEKNLLSELIELHDEYLHLKSIIDSYNEDNISRYHEIESEINNLIEKIDNLTQIHTELTSNLKTIEKKLNKVQNEIINITNINSKNLSKLENINVKINIINNLKFYFYDYILDKKIYESTQTQISLIIKEIDTKSLELKLIQGKLEIGLSVYQKYLKQKRDMEDTINKINLYQTYVSCMNSSGVPYEILKSYIPFIESEVNQVLSQIVQFNIKFELVSDDDNINKAKNSTIYLFITYPNMKPYKVQLTSGYEKFIINLALRMALINVSVIAKPNFIVIDEGWSCFDNTNANNISHIMNYVKTQFEHVIIISHIDQLKNQAEYIINIKRSNNESKILS